VFGHASGWRGPTLCVGFCYAVRRNKLFIKIGFPAKGGAARQLENDEEKRMGSGFGPVSPSILYNSKMREKCCDNFGPVFPHYI
jgi:hypothetical protein